MNDDDSVSQRTQWRARPSQTQVVTCLTDALVSSALLSFAWASAGGEQSPKLSPFPGKQSVNIPLLQLRGQGPLASN